MLQIEEEEQEEEEGGEKEEEMGALVPGFCALINHQTGRIRPAECRQKGKRKQFVFVQYRGGACLGQHDRAGKKYD